MRENDQQLGKPMRLYRDTKANIQAWGLGGGDEGCTAYAIDTNEFGTFNGVGWAWSNHLDWDDVWADAVHTHGSAAEGGVDLGPLDTVQMSDGGLIGKPGDLQIEFDYTNGNLDLRLGDAAGSDEVRVVDSLGGVVLHVDSNGNITMAEDAWQGIGAALERFVFDGTAGEIIVKDAMFVVEGSQGNIVLSNAAGHGNIIEMTRAGACYLRATDAAGAIYVGAGGNADDLQVLATHDVVVLNGKFGVGVAPSYKFDVKTNIADYMAWFFNDGGDNRHGIKVQCGEDTNPDEYFLRFFDGDATGIGRIEGDGAGGVTYHSASDARLKNVLRPVDQDLAMQALATVDPICYVGKGLTEKTGRKNFGFLAQDIHQYFPEIAPFDEETETYGIAYGRLTAVLWAQSQAILARLEKGGL